MVKYNEMAMQTLSDLPTNMPVARVEFDYDYMSRRVGKTVYEWGSNDWQEVSSATFLYDAWNLIAEQTSAETNFFTFGLDLSGTLQGAGGVGGLLSAMLGTNAVCYTYDGNGNVSEVLDIGAGTPSSRILAHYEYSPFGETIVATGGLAKDNSFRFSTKYTDNETSLVYYGYRYYSPSLGRFLSRDPAGEKGFELLRSISPPATSRQDTIQRVVRFLQRHGYTAAEIQEILQGIEMSRNSAMLLNLYAYVWNSPLNAIDPLGDMPEWLKKFLEWLKTTAGYACPSPGGELAGALECGPGLYEIAAREKLRHELIDALIEGDDAKVEEIQKKINDLDKKLKDDAKDCLKDKCCDPDSGGGE